MSVKGSQSQVKSLIFLSQTLACNPSYSGGRDQEDHGSKLTWANSLRDPIKKKKSITKRADGVAQGVGVEFKLHCKKKKKEILYF
jgi:hypothetical protein